MAKMLSSINFDKALTINGGDRQGVQTVVLGPYFRLPSLDLPLKCTATVNS